MAENVLITGGTGLIGTRLTQMLQEKGYQVSYLSRGKKEHPSVKFYQWDVKNNFLETEAIEEADYIIHLAGANVGEKKWSASRKKAIIDSRIQPTQLLISKIKTSSSHKIKAFIGASAVGLYGDTGDLWVDEKTAPANDFLATVCKDWEKEMKGIEDTTIREVVVRVGVVLSEKGGALAEMAKPVKMMAGAALGTGKQYMSWIHLDDICQIFIKAMEDSSMEGAYNGVAPSPVTNSELTKIIADALGKPLFLPKVPAMALRLALGEMADIVLKGSRVSNKKLIDAGFEFKFNSARLAVKDLLGKN